MPEAVGAQPEHIIFVYGALTILFTAMIYIFSRLASLSNKINESKTQRAEDMALYKLMDQKLDSLTESFRIQDAKLSLFLKQEIDSLKELVTKNTEKHERNR